MAATGVQCVAHVLWARVPASPCQPGRKIPAPALQRALGFRREREQIRGFRRRRSLCGLAPLFHHHVRVGSAEPKGAYSRAPGYAVVNLPILRPVIEQKRAVLKINRRIGVLGVNIRWNPLVAQREQHLDKAGNAGSRCQMADVFLDRANPAEPLPICKLTERLCQRFDLDWIAQTRAGSMRLHIADCFGIDAGLAVDSLLQLTLRERIWHREAACIAVLIDPDGANDAMNRIAVAARARQRLQDDNASPFARREAVGVAVKRPAPARLREHSRLRRLDKEIGRGNHAGSARNRHFALPIAQTPTGQMHCREGRRAGRVNGQTRPFQIKKMRDTGSQNRRVIPQQGQGIQRSLQPMPFAEIIARPHPCEYTDRPPRKLPVRITGSFERFPAFFEEQALLRVHPARLPRGAAEEQWVELVGIVEKSAPFSHRAAGCLRVRIVKTLRIPAVGWNFADRIEPALQIAPELIAIMRSWEPPRVANDGNRMFFIHVIRRRRCGRFRERRAMLLGKMLRQLSHAEVIEEFRDADFAPQPRTDLPRKVHNRHGSDSQPRKARLILVLDKLRPIENFRHKLSNAAPHPIRLLRRPHLTRRRRLE